MIVDENGKEVKKLEIQYYQNPFDYTCSVTITSSAPFWMVTRRQNDTLPKKAKVSAS